MLRDMSSGRGGDRAERDSAALNARLMVYASVPSTVYSQDIPEVPWCLSLFCVLVCSSHDRAHVLFYFSPFLSSFSLLSFVLVFFPLPSFLLRLLLYFSRLFSSSFASLQLLPDLFQVLEHPEHSLVVSRLALLLVSELLKEVGFSFPRFALVSLCWTHFPLSFGGCVRVCACLCLSVTERFCAGGSPRAYRARPGTRVFQRPGTLPSPFL